MYVQNRHTFSKHANTPLLNVQQLRISIPCRNNFYCLRSSCSCVRVYWKWRALCNTSTRFQERI